MAEANPTPVENDEPWSIAKEAGLPDNWVPVEPKPIIPGQDKVQGGAPSMGAQGFKSTSDTPPYFSGSLSPDFSHDADYVRSQYATPGVSTTPLMPVPPSAKAQNNSAIKSVIQINQTTTPVSTNPNMLFRGTWKSFVAYAINDVVIFNSSAYIASRSSIGLQPDNNPASWIVLSENLVFNPNPPHQVVTGGFSLYDVGVIAQGSGTAVSVTGTPSAVGEIALLTLVASNGGNSVASGLAGWTQITNRGGQWSYWYKILTDASAVNASATLNISDNWIAALDFFQFGGFSFVTSSQVTINAANQATILIGNASGLIVAGQQVVLSGFVAASFLNGQSVNITTANATQFTCTVAGGHANYGPTADSGIVSVILQQVTNETSGAEFPPVMSVFANNSRASDIFIMTSVAAGIFSGGGLLTGYSDTNGNGYVSTFALNTSGGAHFTLNQGYSTPNKTGGNIVTITIAGGSALTSAGWGAIELAGSASVPLYQPYDVVEFRGSMFVCLSETTNDAFVQPGAWGLIGPGTGFVNSQSGNYTIVALDAGHLISYTGSGAGTFTLPNPVPTPPAGLSETGWYVYIENIGTGTLTIARNGLTIDGAASNLTLGQNQGILLFADTNGNYETWHGVNSIVVPGILTVTVPNGSGQVTIGLATESANTIWAGPTSGAAATPTFRALVNADLPATVPTVPPEFTLTGNVASPAGALAIGKAVESANTVWAGPVSGSAAQPTFRALVPADIPPGVPLALVVAIGTLITHSVSGTLRLPGNIIPPAGVYRVSGFMRLAANPSAGNLDMAITANDGVASYTDSAGANGAPVDISTAATNYSSGTMVIVSDGIHDISWSMTLT